MASSRLTSPTLDAELEQEFASLVERWRAETRFFSLDYQIAMHPAYQRIIGMGPIVLPLILKELETRHGHWFWALQAITGQSPVPRDSTVPEAREAWLAWGRENGFMS